MSIFYGFYGIVKMRDQSIIDWFLNTTGGKFYTSMVYTYTCTSPGALTL